MIINNEIFKDNMFIKRKLKNFYFISYNFFNPKIFFELKEKYGEIIHELRGIQIDINNNKKIVWSIPKFFNYNENEENKLEDIEKIIYCYEKVDGSLIKIYTNNGKIEIATKNGFPKEFINKCWEIIEKNKNLKKFIFNYLKENPNNTLLFELISNINEIVVSYNKENLILLAIRDEYGKFIDIEQFRNIISLPKKYNYDLKLILQQLKILKNFEGFVCLCKFKNNKTKFVKFKTNWYIERHKFYQISDKQLFKLTQEEKIDDFFMYLSENSKKKVIYFSSKLNLLFKTILNDFIELNLFKLSKKEIALSNFKLKKIYLIIYDKDINKVEINLKKFLKKITYKNFLNLIDLI